MNGISASLTLRLSGSLLLLVFSYGAAELSLAVEAVEVVEVAELAELAELAGAQTIPAQESSASTLIQDPQSLSLMSRIIGGRDAQADSWPSLVALVDTGPASVKNRFFCGATVVAERWVMTAAHCLFGSLGQRIQPSSLRVIAGIRNLENDVPTEEVVVSNIVIHPQYRHGVNIPPFDIALLELAATINAPVVSLVSEDPAEYVGDSAYIAGWGATQYVDTNPQGFPSQLQEAIVPVVSLEQCNSIVSYQGLITYRQICAGLIDGGVDACAGDSGGPLFVIEDGIIRQLGITSYGNGCALANFYGIYTSVSHLLPWLSQYINVPFQTPELVTRLDAGLPAADDSNNDSKHDGFFFGATQPLFAFALSLFLVFRRQPFFRR